jgi:mRNA interferase MazF
MNEIHRGDIYWAEPAEGIGCEITGSRPCIVVSNDIGNKHAEHVEVVYLTTSYKSKLLPTHVLIRANAASVALCEGITSVSKERLKEFIRPCTDSEMARIDDALAISVGLSVRKHEPTKAEVERDLYRQMYNQLLTTVVGKANV